mgnify:CR=1 FL=1
MDCVDEMTDRELYDRLANALRRLPMHTTLIDVAQVVAEVLQERDPKFRPSLFIESSLENV